MDHRRPFTATCSCCWVLVAFNPFLCSSLALNFSAHKSIKLATTFSSVSKFIWESYSSFTRGADWKMTHLVANLHNWLFWPAAENLRCFDSFCLGGFEGKVLWWKRKFSYRHVALFKISYFSPFITAWQLWLEANVWFEKANSGIQLLSGTVFCFAQTYTSMNIQLQPCAVWHPDGCFCWVWDFVYRCFHSKK